MMILEGITRHLKSHHPGLRLRCQCHRAPCCQGRPPGHPGSKIGNTWELPTGLKLEHTPSFFG